jgi:hypothetical protein
MQWHGCIYTAIDFNVKYDFKTPTSCKIAWNLFFIALVKPPADQGICLRQRILGNNIHVWAGRDLFSLFAGNRYGFFQITGETPETLLTILRTEIHPCHLVVNVSNLATLLKYLSGYHHPSFENIFIRLIYIIFFSSPMFKIFVFPQNGN